jgi:hypothetical protein
MHSELFPSELGYQAALSLAEGMCRSGLLTEAEMSKARALLVDTYGPPLGSLLAIRNEPESEPHHCIQEAVDAPSAMQPTRL